MNNQRVTVQGRTYLLQSATPKTDAGWGFRLYDLAHPDRQIAYVYGFYQAFRLPEGGWDSVWRWRDSTTDAVYGSAVELVTGILARLKGAAA